MKDSSYRVLSEIYTQLKGNLLQVCFKALLRVTYKARQSMHVTVKHRVQQIKRGMSIPELENHGDSMDGYQVIEGEIEERVG